MSLSVVVPSSHTRIRIVLERLAGPLGTDESRRSVSKPEGITIGRAANVDWPIPDDGLLSRTHLRIVPTDSGCRLIDLGSTNGTNLNDEPAEPHKEYDLKDKDLIQAGRSVFCVHFEPMTSEMIAATEAKTTRALSVLETDHDGNASSSVASPNPGVASSTEPPADRGTKLCRLCKQSFASDSEDQLLNRSISGINGASQVWVCRACRQNHQTIDSFSEHDLAPHFETIRLIGRGSMGVVYLAKHRGTDKHVALKIIDPETATSRTAMDRFLREMAVIGTLKHPNVVECLDQGFEDGHLWFAMEYVSGINLQALAEANRGTYPVNQSCRIICQVLKGVEYAHNLGFVHRDIKPENILIGRTPENRLIAKVSDFGLAKNYQTLGVSGLTFSGEMRGTIPFMPPEQMIDFKTVTPSADLYATAATLYYLIAGTYIFDAEDGSDDMIQMLLDHKIVPLVNRRSDVPQGLSDLILKCLSRDPIDRLPTASAMRNALKAYV